ncbi:MAG: YggS family pyridoxal phosphate-dependent enzyme [Actinomycetia bacterium]|nr:YggS family pyridoxal phosphate-dependent enzyme [Actinomycetes bacterium]
MGDQRAVDQDLVDRLAEQIAERGEVLRRRIEAAATADVEVVAVTKGHPAEVAMAARAAGYRSLGENYAQELRDKAPYLDGVDWHFVGRLQSNKVRMIAPVTAVWQSLDRTSVIDEVAKRCPGAAVMIQVDLAGIGGRGGCDRDDAAGLVAHAAEKGLRVRGLMGVGPPGDPEDSREGFAWLAAEAGSLGLADVSMGMSADLEVALSAGATMVRVGSALVGERPPR